MIKRRALDKSAAGSDVTSDGGEFYYCLCGPKSEAGC